MRRSNTDDNNSSNKKPRIKSLEDYFVRLIEEGNVAELQDLVFNQITSPEKRQDVVNAMVRRGSFFYPFPLIISTALHIAAQSSQPSAVRWLLSDAGGRAAGFNQVLDTVRSDETTALHIAIRNGHVETCKAIVEGCKEENGERSEMLNACDSDGNTILHIAAKKKHLNVIQWILTEGCSAGFEGALDNNSYGYTALHIAVRKRNLAACKLLVGWLKDDDKIRHEFVFANENETAKTALHMAVGNNDLEMIAWLLSADAGGGDVSGIMQCNSRHEYDGGLTALHLALRKGFLEAFLAIVKGCDNDNGDCEGVLNARDLNGNSVLHEAARRNDDDAIRWLLSDAGGRGKGFDGLLERNENDETALGIAIDAGHFKAFFALVEGAKVENGERAELLNAEDKSKSTVLHCASERGNIKIIEWLLSDSGGRANGFNKVCSVDAHGRNVLHLAVRSRKKQAFLAIVEGCKDEEREQLLNGVDSQGRTVLHYAVKQNSTPVIDWLFSETGGIAKGFKRENLFALTNKKENVLHIAAEENGSTEIFDLLLSRCDNTSERLRLFLGRDDKGWTIFYHAARSGNAELISHILRKYPEESTMIIDARDNRGMTVLHRTIIPGIDEESREEWGDERQNSLKQPVIAALLGMKEGGFAAAAGADPNVGLKFE